MELQLNVDIEDGALGQLNANHSSIRRTRSLTEKGRRYQLDTLLEKRKRAISRMQRKAIKPLMIYFIQLVIRLLFEKNLISILICLSWSPIAMKNIANYWMLKTINMKSFGLMILTKMCLTLNTEYTVG